MTRSIRSGGAQLKRPSFIRHWREIEREAPHLHPHSGEPMVRVAPFAARFELKRLGIRHDTILPGWRSSQPHAERDEEEMVFILEGTPDLWVDGMIYRMESGECAGWAGRDGQAHCLINNTDQPVRMLTIGEASRYNSHIHFPLAREMDGWLDQNHKRWMDAPRRRLGVHDGLPDAVRKKPSSKSARLKKPPSCVVDWRKIQTPGTSYPGDTEPMGAWSHLSVHLGLTRVGVGLDELAPGVRSSWPHAEFDEEEFVFVVSGAPDAWIDGQLYRLQAGDGVGFPDRTGIAHCFINNSNEPVQLITVGEASRQRSKCFYPLHPKRNKEIGNLLWRDPPKRKIGSHDGLSNLRRRMLKSGGRGKSS